NTGFGDPHSAGEEVEYINGATTTASGKWRARNGHSQPFAVRWWGVGNEMYGTWQLGHMSLNQYTIKHNETVRKMRDADPTIKLVASGDMGPWTEGMLARCADAMDLLSEHFYRQERKEVPAHVAQIAESIRAKAAAHRRYRETIPQLRGKDIRI